MYDYKRKIAIINFWCLFFLFGNNTIILGFENIVIPNPDILDKKVDQQLNFFSKSIFEKNIYPWQLILDIDKGKILGAIAIYDDNVKFEDVSNRINKQYKKFLVISDSQLPHKAWRVEPKKFIISLGKNDDNQTQMILMRFLSPPEMMKGMIDACFDCMEAGDCPCPFVEQTESKEKKE